ncbi:MAG: phosphoglucosamine mutase [Thaumarchaeota archaeon]|nr:phosphoglucosamine mutase [Nitrososphaerota archaeon]
MGKLFGTNGIRGVFGSELTLDLALDVSYALATYFHDKPILLGYDGRHSSPIISKVVRAGMNALGVDVANAGLIPTPCLQFCVKTFGYKGGAMITASHNPPEYNGIKVMAHDGIELCREEELKVEEIYFNKNFKNLTNKIGNVTHENRAVESYINGIKLLVNTDLIRSKKLTVVLDLGNGAQIVTAPKLMEELGCKVIIINSQIDGSFPGRGSEPTPDNLDLLRHTVEENSADLGIAYDGDGDRTIFCDEKSNVYGGDKSGAILTEHVLSKNGNAKVVTPINSSTLIDIVSSKYNSTVTRTKVGSVEVSRKMLKNDALIGLEENGGFMYGKHIAVRDGAITSALMLELITNKAKLLSQIMSELPKFYQYKTKFTCTKEQSGKVVEHLIKHRRGKVETLDGVKIWIKDSSWVMVRQSGTEPVMRLYAEASDSKLLSEIVENYSRQIKELVSELEK